MADIVITAANVVPGSDAVIEYRYTAGETITAGMSVYFKTSDSKWYKAQTDGTAAESGSGSGNALGIALASVSASQPCPVQTSGSYTVGGTVAAGVFYYVSNTAGGIAPVADLGTGDYSSVIIYGLTTTTAQVYPRATGLTLA